MKIDKVIGYGLTSPIKGDFVYYGYQNSSKNIGIIEVHFDNGIIGYGETYAGVYCVELIEPTVKYLEQFLIGKENNFDTIIENIPYIGKSGLLKSIYSGIEIAIYDALSKHQQLPLWNYLSKTSKEPQLYASNGSAIYTPNQIEEDVKDILDKGFTSYKMRIGVQSIEQDIERLKVARKYLGDGNLMVDAIMGTNPDKWSLKTAKKWSEILKDFNVYWLEEPFKPDYINGYKELKNLNNVPIAGGEALNQQLEFNTYFEKEIVDIIQPDVTNSGGIIECIRIIEMFKPENVAMHVWGSQIAINSNYHIAKAFKVLFLEVPLMELEINDHICCKDGGGIGIKITDKIKEKYKLQPKTNFKL
jgi:L-alanine-DL-glutamate epimerase-like enolase superfamily enzyme